MANVKATWTLPTVAKDQKPIKHVKLELSADSGSNFTVLGNVLPTAAQEFSLSDVDAGAGYVFRATVVDTADTAGVPVAKAFSVPVKPPGQVQNLTVSIT